MLLTTVYNTPERRTSTKCHATLEHVERIACYRLQEKLTMVINRYET